MKTFSLLNFLITFAGPEDPPHRFMNFLPAVAVKGFNDRVSELREKMISALLECSSATLKSHFIGLSLLGPKAQVPKTRNYNSN